MIIAYWNTQRASGLRSRNLEPQARCLWCCQQILQWILATINTHQAVPSLIFLSEVSQGGGELAAYLNSFGGGYRARYIAAGDRNNNASPCSFIVMWQEELNPEIKIIGISQRRPLVRVRMRDLTVGGVHIIANSEKAPDEILDDIAELHSEPHPAVLIGDMNYAWSSLDQARTGNPESLEDEVDYLYDWEPVHPQLQATFGKVSETGGFRTQILDYLWKSEDVSRIEAMPPFPGYNQWTQIDHAPIAYRIHLNDEDELMTDEEDEMGDDARSAK
ncbi:endonuclease/exonuclease/phosphatase family protein [Corallococcus exiguus]|uniref:endonuclease/exonuclease/phosphatase family protein n=1 Tax=Corallococcus TaxID=83461 RepID=UPI000ED03004|nr:MULTISPECIES: endonuclease/exonuclease/phosphatase family protein [Corallococcus]NNB94605.1 endonuclease/exonuclease/phosphatase family protein [Corallococcus exiguus]NNC04277.1 endonuclease/exonuclease/phosphatase family protein [Corallococcus exiguus]NPC48920.1 endonuclease/exonuclease/phosphatase family protein [Corallococcus exiguus]RKH84954.1 endonuclease/exonuclease/phosphatase family protein [Corallococcus sp. AB032C]